MLAVRRAKTIMLNLPAEERQMHVRDGWRLEAGRSLEEKEHSVDREMQWLRAITYLSAIMRQTRSRSAFATRTFE